VERLRGSGERSYSKSMATAKHEALQGDNANVINAKAFVSKQNPEHSKSEGCSLPPLLPRHAPPAPRLFVNTSRGMD
jgi:hypothetical protein